MHIQCDFEMSNICGEFHIYQGAIGVKVHYVTEGDFNNEIEIHQHLTKVVDANTNSGKLGAIVIKFKHDENRQLLLKFMVLHTKGNQCLL
jgi:hypothetical protein